MFTHQCSFTCFSFIAELKLLSLKSRNRDRGRDGDQRVESSVKVSHSVRLHFNVRCIPYFQRFCSHGWHYEKIEVLGNSAGNVEVK